MRRAWRIVLPLLLCWGVWILNPASAWAVNTTLEATILEVVQHHPEAILESLATYQTQQQEQAHQAQLQAINQLKQNIPDVVGSSPILEHSQHSTVTLRELHKMIDPTVRLIYP